MILQEEVFQKVCGLFEYDWERSNGNLQHDGRERVVVIERRPKTSLDEAMIQEDNIDFPITAENTQRVLGTNHPPPKFRELFAQTSFVNGKQLT